MINKIDKQYIFFIDFIFGISTSIVSVYLYCLSDDRNVFILLLTSWFLLFLLIIYINIKFLKKGIKK